MNPKAIAVSDSVLYAACMIEELKKRRREQAVVRLLPKVKEAAIRAAADEDRSLSGFVEEVLAERLKKTGYLK